MCTSDVIFGKSEDKIQIFCLAFLILSSWGVSWLLLAIPQQLDFSSFYI